MGMFDSPITEDVEHATQGPDEKWDLILNVCDSAKESPQKAKECLASIMARLRTDDTKVALRTVTLLDACINNCGKTFHSIVASKLFEDELRKILKKADSEVRSRILRSMKSWCDGDFKSDGSLSLIPSLYNKLIVEYPSAEPEKTTKSVGTSKVADDTYTKKEVDDLAKAIELSLIESTSPKGKSAPSSLYPSTVFSPQSEGKKVRALYDFEADEDNELSFKAGEIVSVIDDSDPNWWKGQSKRGEGLFPSNFVTADLNLEPEQPRLETKKSVQFDEAVHVKKIVKEEVEINEDKMDSLLHYLHEADPTRPGGDPPDILDLADEVNAMGPLIDTELERVDSRHAQLSQLSMDLVDALNLYHSLMPEPTQPAYLSKPVYGFPHQQQMNGVPTPGMMPYNVIAQPGPSMPSIPQPGHPNIFPAAPHASLPNPGVPHVSLQNGPPLTLQFVTDASGRPINGVPMYGTVPPQAGPYSIVGPTGQPTLPQPSYHDKPPLL